MNMSKLNKLEKDLRSSAKLNKFQALNLKGGDDKRNRGSNPGVTAPVTTNADIQGIVSSLGG